LAAPRLGIDDAKTTFSFQLLEKTADGTKVVCQILFHTDTGEAILEKELERWLCDNKRLLGRSGRSRVACRVKFYVRRNLRGQGFAYYISMKEEELFRRWGAKEIHTTAMDDGRWAWTRPRFGYSIPVAEFQLLQQRYIEWQRETLAAAIIKASTMTEFPREFLLSAVGSVTLFKSL
jgi:GNAT superfamily N-acetyltransferase